MHMPIVGIVQHFWAIVLPSFSHVGAVIHVITTHGLPTGLGFIGF
jgi:hypothetical protein